MTSPIIIPTRERGWGTARSHNGSIQDAVIPGVVVVSVSAQPLVVNRDEFAPWRIYSPIKIDQLLSEVTVTGGTNFRMGLYAANEKWQPGKLLIDSGNLSSASTGVKTYTTAVILPPGRYLSVINSDGSPTFRVYMGVMESHPVISSLGPVAILNAGGDARTYGAFPNPATQQVGDTDTNSASAGWWHIVAYRLESLL